MKFLSALILTSWASCLMAADLGSPIPLDQRVATLEQDVAAIKRHLGLPDGPAAPSHPSQQFKLGGKQPTLVEPPPVTYTLVNGQLVRSDAAGDGCYTDAAGNTVCPASRTAPRFVPAQRKGPLQRIFGR